MVETGENSSMPLSPDLLRTWNESTEMRSERRFINPNVFDWTTSVEGAASLLLGMRIRRGRAGVCVGGRSQWRWRRPRRWWPSGGGPRRAAGRDAARWDLPPPRAATEPAPGDAINIVTREWFIYCTSKWTILITNKRNRGKERELEEMCTMMQSAVIRSGNEYTTLMNKPRSRSSSQPRRA